MSKTAVSQWDTTANNNTDVGGISLAENVMQPPAVNDAIREIMAQIASAGFVTSSSTVTLTNKSLSDSTTYIVDNSDATKKAQFEASGITTGTTRTFTFPDATGTLALLDAQSGSIYGLTLSNNVSDGTNDIDIATGVAMDSTNVRFIKLSSGLTKRLDAAWAVGTGNGGLDTGAIADTTYHMWAIMRSDTGVVDVLFSASASSPTMPTNYDYKRRIGSVVRSGAALKAFKQVGDVFTWDVQTSDVVTSNPGTSAVTSALTVPTGIVVNATIMASLTDATPVIPTNVLVTPLSITDTAPSSSSRTLFLNSAGASVPSSVQTVMQVATNTSGQIRYRLDFSDVDRAVRIQTIGWQDTRGRLA